MKFESSAFGTDKLTLSWWDMIRLLFGRTIKDGALEIKVRPRS